MKTIVCILLTLLISAPMVNAQKKIKQTAGRDQLGDFAPKFAELNDLEKYGVGLINSVCATAVW